METAQQIEVGKLKAQIRHKTGKSVAHKLRAEGYIPAVVYGQKTESLMLTVDPIALKKSLDPGKRHNTVIELSVEGGDKPEVLTVMLKDYQIDTIKQTVLHADFIRVDVNQPIEVTVPLVLTGKAEGVKLGGNLHQVFRDLPVECTPKDIPAEITADVTPMQLNDSMQIKDLAVTEGVKILLPPSQTVALVMAPKAAAEEEAEGEAAEGEGEGEGEGAAEGEAKEAAAKDKD